jgi:CHAD domain-containing protein
LKKAVAALRKADPEGLHDVRVALRRIGASASALGEKTLARRAKTLVRSLSDRRQLEVDRQLLARVRELGVLSPDVAAGLDARWDALFTAGAREAEKVLTGRPMRRLFHRLSGLDAAAETKIVRRLQRARRAADRTVAHPPSGQSDRELHRYRIAVKRARYLLEDLALLCSPNAEPSAARLKAVQEALGRWNDTRLFCRRLARTRREAEKRGSVTLALELDHLLAALDRTVEKARADALKAVRPLSNLVTLERRTA